MKSCEIKMGGQRCYSVTADIIEYFAARIVIIN